MPLKDAKSLSAALRRLIEAPAMVRQMGERGRARVLDEFSLHGVIAATISLYSELLE